MTKVLSTAFVLVFAVMTAYVVVQQRTAAHLSRQLEEQTDAITQTYGHLAETQVFPIENSPDLTQDQRHSAARVRATLSKLGEDMEIGDKVVTINELQLALLAFLYHTTSSPEFGTSSGVAVLRHELGPNGRVRPDLDAYNQTARYWNDIRSRPLFTLQASLTPVDADMLPYLRFDGAQEFVPIITM